MSENNKHLYVDGVISYHSLLDKAFREALKSVPQEVPTGKGLEEKIKEWKEITLFVDYTKPQEKNILKGCLFLPNNIIVRYINFDIEFAALFPVTDHLNHTVAKKGLEYGDLFFDLMIQNRPILIKFTKNNTDTKEPILFDIEEIKNPITQENFIGLDDIGMPVKNFPDIQRLKVIDIPDQWLRQKFKLIDKEIYAPFTKESGIQCVLFAPTDVTDEPLIKVFRWFPVSKKEWLNNHFYEDIHSSDVFYELGHVDKTEGKELYQFMINNDSQILFGEMKSDEISIMGGIKILKHKDFNFPMCLYQIPLS